MLDLFFAALNLYLCILNISAAVDIDNAVIGSPTVECEREIVRFKAFTKRPFHGKVYVKGEFSNPKCITYYGAGTLNSGKNEGEDENDHQILIDSPHLKGPLKAPTSGKFTSKSYTNHPTLVSSSRRVKIKKGRDDADDFNDENLLSTPFPSTSSARLDVTASPGNRPNNRTVSAPAESEMEDFAVETELRKLLNELAAINKANSARSNPKSNLPGFNTIDAIRGWRNFLLGKPGMDGRNFRRYGSRISPDANGECPLICPPCEECQQLREQLVSRRKRRRREGNTIEFEAPLDACNAKRDRTANPYGLHVSLTIVVSFHDNFITRVDRAYNVQCAYHELQQAVDTRIDVSAPPIINLNGTGRLPQCEYRINKVSSQGANDNDFFSPSVVQVGETVEHEWICGKISATTKGSSPDEGENFQKMFGLLVHDCYIDDGRSRRELIVDEHGCSLDPFILPTPSYSKQHLSAKTPSNVVKFPDGDLLGFQCSITVCMRDMGHCEGVTPPICEHGGSPAEKRRPKSTNRQRRTPAAANRSTTTIDGNERLLDWNLNSPTFTVIDPVTVDKIGSTESTEAFSILGMSNTRKEAFHLLQNVVEEEEEEFCMSVFLFGTLISASTFTVTIFFGILISTVFLRHFNLIL